MIVYVLTVNRRTSSRVNYGLGGAENDSWSTGPMKGKGMSQPLRKMVPSIGNQEERDLLFKSSSPGYPRVGQQEDNKK